MKRPFGFYKVPLIVILVLVTAPLFATDTHVSSLRSDGTILVNGKPFFPYGYMTWNNLNDTQRLEALRAHVKAGFNTMTAQWTDPNTFGTFLDSADKAGILVIPSDGVIDRYKGKPAVLAWFTIDDAQDFSLDAFTSRNNAVRQKDPNHLTFATWASSMAEGYFAGVDISSYQDYPVEPETDFTYQNGQVARMVAMCAKYGKAPISLPQSFTLAKWNMPWPTVRQFRVMTYASLVVGVRGIIHYSYEITYGKKQDVWDEAAAMSPEISALSQALLDGKRTMTVGGANTLNCAYWEYQNCIYVIAANWGSTSKSVSISLPAGTTGTLKSLFTRFPVTLTLQNAKLTGTIGGDEVQVYRIDMYTAISP